MTAPDAGGIPSASFPTPIELQDRDLLRSLLRRRATAADQAQTQADRLARIQASADAAKDDLQDMQGQRQAHVERMQAFFAGEVAKKPDAFPAARLMAAEDEAMASAAALNTATDAANAATTALQQLDSEIYRVSLLICRHQLDALLARRQQLLREVTTITEAAASLQALCAAAGRRGNAEAYRLAEHIPVDIPDPVTSDAGVAIATEDWQALLIALAADPDATLEGVAL